jgi:hypothetical protein
VTVKLAWFVRARDPARREHALRAWREEQAPRIVAIDGVERYVENTMTASITGSGIGDEPVAYDGYGCAWFRDRASYFRAIDGHAWREAQESVADVLEVAEGRSALVDERVVRRTLGEDGTFKVIWVVGFHRDRAWLEADRYWAHQHARFALRCAETYDYVQNHAFETIGGIGLPEGPHWFDGFSECWFADRASFERTLADPAWRRLDEDAATLFHLEDIWGGMSGVVEERVVEA